MKRRIISTVLVVVMLALTLVGCGYNFTKEDMSENAKFVDGMSKEAFMTALMSLSATDADFGNINKTEQREQTRICIKEEAAAILTNKGGKSDK